MKTKIRSFYEKELLLSRLTVILVVKIELKLKNHANKKVEYATGVDRSDLAAKRLF